MTQYGSYEFLMMPFGLSNAPATFCTLTYKVLQHFLDQFVVVYLDAITFYSRTLEEHTEHLCQVFEVLKENELFIKKDKYSFAQPEVTFLDHIIGTGTIRMCQKKVKSILEWQPPTKVFKLQSFLGLANYYQWFIHGYSHVTTPLTDLLKKGLSWDWSRQRHETFEALKKAITEKPILALPDHSKPFEVPTYASDFVIGEFLCKMPILLLMKSESSTRWRGATPSKKRR